MSFGSTSDRVSETWIEGDPAKSVIKHIADGVRLLLLFRTGCVARCHYRHHRGNEKKDFAVYSCREP